jgi:hypothetical protein
MGEGKKQYKQYMVVRVDSYIVYFKAKDMVAAKKRVRCDDALLNSGSYAGSDFEELTEYR